MIQGRQEPNLLGFWYTLYTRRWLIVLVVASAMLSAWVLSLVLPPVYEARALFFVPSEAGSTTFLGPPTGSLSRETLAPIPTEDANGPYIGVLGGKTIAELVANDFPTKTARDLMRKDIDVGLTEEYLLEVYARDRDPKVAAGIANAYVRYFNKVMSDYSLQSQGEIAETLRGQLAEHRRLYEESVAKLRNYESEKKIGDLKSEMELLTKQRADFANQIEQARVARWELNPRIDAVRGALRKESQALTTDALSQDLTGDSYLGTVKAQLVNLEMKMAEQVDVTESHLDLVALRNSYAAVKESLEREMTRIVKSEVKSAGMFYEDLRRQLVNLYVEGVQLDARVQALSTVIEGVDRRVQAFQGYRLEIDRLQNKIDYHKKVIDQLELNQEESAAQVKRAPVVAVVVDAASPPEQPAFPIIWLNLMVAFLAGTAVALFYALFMDYLERTRGQRIWRLLRAVDVPR